MCTFVFGNYFLGFYAILGKGNKISRQNASFKFKLLCLLQAIQLVEKGNNLYLSHH
jgi:hypothetical protein